MKFFNSFNPPWYVPLALLLLALMVGLIRVRSLWEEIHEEEDPATERERLNELERAYAAGELDAEEFRKVRDLLVGSELANAPAPLRTRPAKGPGLADAPDARDPSSADDSPGPDTSSPAT